MANMKRAPKHLVAVAKGSGRILAAYEINNSAWFTDGVNRRRKRIVAVPLKDKKNANASKMQGMRYTGKRQGGAVSYGHGVG